MSTFYEGGSLTEAGKTAAIVCPIIFAVVVVAVIIRQLHITTNNKTADFSEQMDQRMSRISIDWSQDGDGSLGPLPGSRPASFLPQADANGRWSGAPLVLPQPVGDHRSVAFNSDPSNNRISATQAELHALPPVEHSYA